MTRSKIYVAGHNGMVGSAIVRLLKKIGQHAISTAPRTALDLTNQSAVDAFFAAERPEQVYLAAAKVGGIHANNTFPAEFVYQNLMIQANIIQAAHTNNVQKLLFLGSSCMYPKAAAQPMPEDALLTGVLESTNEPYAIAKIAGIKLCESFNRQYGRDYRCIVPTNLYGPGDNYHPDNAHVIPALLRRFHEAKTMNLPVVKIWGSGTPRREFLYVDDLAAASVHVMNLDKNLYDQYTQPMQSYLNVGYGHEISIKELAALIKQIVGYCGAITFDQCKPDGTQRKLLDSSRLNALGWRPTLDLEKGLDLAYKDFQKNYFAYTQGK